MVKEKIIFIALVPMFIGVVIFGFVSQGFREEAARELLEEIDLATRKSRAKVNAAKDRWDFDRVKGVDTIDGYT
ncbi:MAG: hypothetical protein QGI05_02555, partial [Candidatus Omnitrophota bacterium]|nr:hypothetical protein [Candidatus Omnitrophota bacterium]